MHDREADILNAAERLFMEGGLEALTVRALVARSGTSTGSVYHRYGDRGGVLMALALRALEEGLRDMVVVVGQAPGARRGVVELVHTWLSWVEARPTQARIVYALFGAPELGPYEAELLRIKAGLYAPIFAWFRGHMDAGALRPLPVWALDPIVFGPVHELARRWLVGAPLPMDEARAIVTEAVWRALAPDPDPSSEGGRPPQRVCETT